MAYTPMPSSPRLRQPTRYASRSTAGPDQAALGRASHRRRGGGTARRSPPVDPQLEPDLDRMAVGGVGRRQPRVGHRADPAGLEHGRCDHVAVVTLRAAGAQRTEYHPVAGSEPRAHIANGIKPPEVELGPLAPAPGRLNSCSLPSITASPVRGRADRIRRSPARPRSVSEARRVSSTPSAATVHSSSGREPPRRAGTPPSAVLAAQRPERQARLRVAPDEPPDACFEVSERQGSERR